MKHQYHHLLRNRKIKLGKFDTIIEDLPCEIPKAQKVKSHKIRRIKNQGLQQVKLNQKSKNRRKK